jgi:hypothetical protein
VSAAPRPAIDAIGLRNGSAPRACVDRTWSLWLSLAVVLLIVAAGAKVWTATTDLRILEVADPVLFVKNRYVMVAVATAELLCATVLSRTRNPRLQGLLLLWLSANFVLYRAALALSGAGAPCPCLGNLGALLGLGTRGTELLPKAIAGYLLSVGLYLVIRYRSGADDQQTEVPRTDRRRDAKPSEGRGSEG